MAIEDVKAGTSIRMQSNPKPGTSN